MSSVVIDVNDLPNRFEEMLTLATRGGQVLVSAKDHPRAQLVPLPKPKALVLGLNPGTVQMADDFDAPLPDEFWTGTP